MSFAGPTHLGQFLAIWLILTDSLFAAQSVVVSWNANPEPDITQYSVYYSDLSKPAAPRSRVNVRETRAVITGLIEGRSYLFYVTAWNSSDLESAPSEPVTWFVNTPPRLSLIPDQIAQVGARLSVQALARDPDPAQALSFVLLPGAPYDARIDSRTGVFTWTPFPLDTSSTNVLEIQVTDDGLPPMSDRILFTVIVQAPDSNRDGIPDWYDQLSAPNRPAWDQVSLDPDADGFTNLEEYGAGTDPDDRGSALRIVSVAPSGDDMAISFTSVPGRFYRLERADETSAGRVWGLVKDLTADSAIMIVLDSGANLLRSRFYRVSVMSEIGQVASAPYGFTTLKVSGQPESELALTLLGFGVTRPVDYYGTVEGVRSNQLIDRWGTWAEGEFSSNSPPHYLEVTSGPSAGFRANILSASRSVRSLVLGRMCPNLTNGETYVIRPDWTVAELFGRTNECGLGTAGDRPADQVFIIDLKAQAWGMYHYQTGGTGGVGWRSGVNDSADQSQIRIGFGQGLIVLRNRSDDLTVRVYGSLKSGKSLVEISPGLNLVANIFPNAITLGASGLYTGTPANGLTAGFGDSVDRVLIRAGQSYQTYYYQSAELGGRGWRSALNRSLDAAATVIPAGSSFFIDRRNPAPFTWEITSP